MQSTFDASHFWTWLIGAFIAGAAGVAAFFKVFLERKQPQANIHETEARTRLANADARNKDADTMSEVFETLRLAHKSLDLESKERREVAEKLETCERNVRNLMARTKQLEDENRKYKKLLKLN